MHDARRRAAAFAAALISMLFSTSLLAQEAIGFSKTFTPDTIGPGSTSTLQFDITNFTSTPAEDLAFEDILPADVTLATPAVAATSCVGGSVSAADGGSSISLSGGSVGAGASCDVTVNVTSPLVGEYVNTSGDLTSSLGNHGPASDVLNVLSDRPGFSKSFSPSSVDAGERSTLTFIIDNSLNAADVLSLSFTDNLPGTMVIANPPNLATDCTLGTLSAVPGSAVINYSYNGNFVQPALDAGAICTITVDVVAGFSGILNNVSSDLTYFVASGAGGSAGKASASLDVNVESLHLIKEFIDDPAVPGTTTTLEFSIFNRTRAETAAEINFEDDLQASGLFGLVATGLPQPDICGDGSSISGTGNLVFSGGSLAPGANCTFTVTLNVPAAAVPGGYHNETTPVDAVLSDSGPFTGNKAADILFVEEVPLLTKTFLTNPVGAGSTTTMEFSITNTSADPATDIAFTDNLTDFISSLSNPGSVTSLPADGFCGAGSTMTTIGGGQFDPLLLLMTGGSLAGGDSCTFSVDIELPVGVPGGSWTNTTSEITVEIDETPVVGPAASDELEIAQPVRVSKNFTDDPVDPGGTVTLEFQLSNTSQAAGDATAITFTDDLSLTGIAGLVSTSGTLVDVCGAGSQIGGTDLLTLTGGSLLVGETCTFQVVLSVPAGTALGVYENVTSDVTATVAGVETTGAGGSADLLVGGLTLAKSFTNDPVIPGGVVTLEFSISNDSASDATAMSFSDDLDAVLNLQSGSLTAIPPALVDPCGTGSALSLLSGNEFLSFNGGNLLAGTSCTFSIDVQVPANAPSGIWTNRTSDLLATLNSDQVVLPRATDQLEISDEVMAFTKSFDQDTVAPGANIGLTFNITNLSATDTVTDITFSDDLDAALSGLVATGLPSNDVCGVGSVVNGTDTITLTGGSLGPSASCQFTVTLAVPANAGYGAVADNVTSPVTGLVGNLGVIGLPASDSFSTLSIVFNKSFADGDIYPGGGTTLTFSIENLSNTAVDRLGFTDDLDAVVPGLMASGLPLTDICGIGSTITGTSVLVFTDGILGPGESCIFDVGILVPAGAAVGDYLNVTSPLSGPGGFTVANPATDILTLVPATTTVCHKPFTPAQQTLEILITSLKGHLGHGDFEGECDDEPDRSKGKPKKGG